MKTQISPLTTVEKIEKFVNQRSGIVFRDYAENGRDIEGIKAFNSDYRQIINDRQDFYSILNLAIRRLTETKLNEMLTEVLTTRDGRLTMNKETGKLNYCEGQYFPTEYRKAAARIVANMVWASYRDEIEHNTPNNVYKDANQMRAAIKKHVSRRVMNNYFN